MASAKIVLHHRGPGLRNPEVRANVVHDLLDVDGTYTAQRVRLHILVQQFIGIQFRTVRRQEENPDLLTVLCQPTSHRSRLVHRVTIYNQKHLLPGLPRQSQEPAKKIQKYARRKTLPENHESQSPPIGDGRDHVAAKALTRTKYHGRLPAPSVRSARLMVRTHPHLVYPINVVLKLSRLFSNHWIFFVQP